MTDDGEEGEVVFYTGQESEALYRNAIHVEVHPSLKAIQERAFLRCSMLLSVILGDELEEIGKEAFYE
jgi:hypothetical protein